MPDTDSTTVIAADAHVKGELTFESQARVFGSVEGKIQAKGDLHVAEGGVCRAKVEAENLQVDGVIEGNITAGERLQISGHGKVQGDIVAEKLITAEGASIIGHVNVGTGASEAEPPTVARKSADPEQAVEAAAAR